MLGYANSVKYKTSLNPYVQLPTSFREINYIPKAPIGMRAGLPKRSDLDFIPHVGSSYAHLIEHARKYDRIDPLSRYASDFLFNKRYQGSIRDLFGTAEKNLLKFVANPRPEYLREISKSFDLFKDELKNMKQSHRNDLTIMANLINDNLAVAIDTVEAGVGISGKQLRGLQMLIDDRITGLRNYLKKNIQDPFKNIEIPYIEGVGTRSTIYTSEMEALGDEFGYDPAYVAKVDEAFETISNMSNTFGDLRNSIFNAYFDNEKIPDERTRRMIRSKINQAIPTHHKKLYSRLGYDHPAMKAVMSLIADGDLAEYLRDGDEFARNVIYEDPRMRREDMPE